MSGFIGWLRTLFGRGRAEKHYECFMGMATRVASDEDTILAFNEISAAIGIDEGNLWYRVQRATFFLLYPWAFRRCGLPYESRENASPMPSMLGGIANLL